MDLDGSQMKIRNLLSKSHFKLLTIKELEMLILLVVSTKVRRPKKILN